MSDNGYVLAYRRAWEHPIFRDKLDAAIWNYLYQNAAWRDCRIFSHGTRIDLRRGQIFVTMRELAKGFCCAEARVRRLAEALSGDAMIETQPTHRGTIITICNYEDYQPREDTADAPSSKPAARKRRTSDALSNKEETRNEGNETKSPPYPPPPAYLDPVLWEAFREMRRGIKEPMTSHAEVMMLRRLEKYKQQGHDPTEMLEQSIRNNWKDVYPIKGDRNENTGRISSNGNGGGSQQGRTGKPSWDDAAANLAAKYRAQSEG